MKIKKKSCANELGRLAQGTGDPLDVTDAIFYIAKYQVHNESLKDVMYGFNVVDCWPHKS